MTKWQTRDGRGPASSADVNCIVVAGDGAGGLRAGCRPSPNPGRARGRRRSTEIWQKNGPKRTFEWGQGSLFAPPKNTYYRMFNLGREPVLYFGVTTAPRLMNGLFPAGGGSGNGVSSTSQFEEGRREES